MTKLCAGLLFLFLSQSTAFAATVVLRGGSSVTLKPTEETTVFCIGSPGEYLPLCIPVMSETGSSCSIRIGSTNMGEHYENCDQAIERILELRKLGICR